jgi:hypothetical protein
MAVITDEMQAELSRQLDADFDKLAATALRIRDERDVLAAALRIARDDFHACYVATGNEMAFSAYDRIDKALTKARL